MPEAFRLGAKEAARLIESGELAAAALIASCHERVAAREPTVKAWTYLAREFPAANASPAPLFGVPVGVKDIFNVDGFPTHGTSIPGVAQRTGSTTYYVELYTERGAEEPAFSLYPVPGALDVLVAPEFMEVGRMIELGFVSPSRTTVIASTHRLLSIHEKIATGRAIYPQEALQRAAQAASHRLIAFDALVLARQHGTEANAV